MNIKYPVACAFVLALLTTIAYAQNERDIAVRTDKQALSKDATWIYDDLDLAIAEAATTKRPLMIVFR